MNVEQAKQLCIIAHDGQFRRDGITPYSSHPIAVANLMTNKLDQILAYLHDVIEDTSAELVYNKTLPCRICFNGVNYDITKRLYKQLFRITHQPEQSYEEYIKVIAESNDPSLIRVKIADMFHNMSTTTSEKQKDKYMKHLPILLEAI